MEKVQKKNKKRKRVGEEETLTPVAETGVPKQKKSKKQKTERELEKKEKKKKKKQQAEEDPEPTLKKKKHKKSKKEKEPPVIEEATLPDWADSKEAEAETEQYDTEQYEGEEEEEYVPKPPQRPAAVEHGVRVFLGNLSFKIDEETIRKTFKKCGDINAVNFVLDKKTGKFYGSAFVEFNTVDAAKGAMGFTGKKVLGRPMKVGWASNSAATANAKGAMNSIKATPISKKPEGCTQCFLGNLPYDVEEDDIYTFFDGFGDLKEVRWLMNGDEFRGAGFVEFTSSNDTDLAVTRNGDLIKGRPVRVDYAPAREGHSF